jgi:hypothetical protein
MSGSVDVRKGFSSLSGATILQQRDSDGLLVGQQSSSLILVPLMWCFAACKLKGLAIHARASFCFVVLESCSGQLLLDITIIDLHDNCSNNNKKKRKCKTIMLLIAPEAGTVNSGAKAFP